MEAMDSDMDLFSNMNPTYDLDYELANAPTPFMSNFMASDLEDIDNEDLLRFPSNPIVSESVVVDNNNELFDFDVNREVLIESHRVSPDTTDANAEQMLYSVTHEDVNQMYGTQTPTVQHLVINTRKRTNTQSFAQTVDDSDDDQSSVATRPHTSTVKSRPGRKPSKVTKCMSKNAVAARQNREKKKEEFDNMQKRLSIAEHENKAMKSMIERLTEEKADLVNENTYLRAIIANDSQISQVIKHVSALPRIELIGPEFVGEGSAKSEIKLTNGSSGEKSTRKSSRIAAKVDGPGICVHIKNNDSMSLRLCDQCSFSTKKSTKKAKWLNPLDHWLDNHLEKYN